MDAKTSSALRLCIVVPCFNESEALKQTDEILNEVLLSLKNDSYVSDKSYILYVDDGSTDRTWDLLNELKADSDSLQAIKFSRNFGHQNALFAGLMHAKETADCTVSIDADLQQDPWAIGNFIDKYREGCEVVLGVRENRETDGLMKKFTAWLYYRLLRFFGVDLVVNHADYRLLGQQALKVLSQYDEYNLFLRGLVLDLGFKQATVDFIVSDRLYGTTKYTLAKMFRLALDGITSFTTTPLRLFSILGVFIVMLSGLSLGYVLMIRLLGDPVPGWASTLLPIYLIGGFNALGIGLLGEYVSKIYSEIKKRPRYIIEDVI